MTILRESPLISVIVPNYNYACYMKERMDSILNQTFQDFEIIILDDASTDDSPQIIDQYRSLPQVSLIVITEMNSGTPFKQWQKGVRMARGKYIWIAEADDVADRNFLETTVSLMEKHPETSICHVGYAVIDSQSNVSRKDYNKWGRRRAKRYACFDGVEYVKHNLYWRNCIYNASGVLFRRDKAISIADSSFATMRYCGDWRFWIDLSLSGEVIEVYKVLNYFRRHGESVTHSGNQYGRILKEEISMVRYMQEILDGFSSYKKCIRGAIFYKRISRMPYEANIKKDLYCYLKQELHIRFWHFVIERISKYLSAIFPFMLTPKRDRL